MIPTTEEELPEDMQDLQNEPLQMVLNQEVMRELSECCQALPPPYDTIALQHFVEGLSAKEIANRMGVNIHTVQTQIYRAREKLKKALRLCL